MTLWISCPRRIPFLPRTRSASVVGLVCCHAPLSPRVRSPSARVLGLACKKMWRFRLMTVARRETSQWLAVSVVLGGARHLMLKPVFAGDHKQIHDCKEMPQRGVA